MVLRAAILKENPIPVYKVFCGTGSAKCLRGGAAWRAKRANMASMTATETAVRTVKFYTNGTWEDAPGRALHPIVNPATGQTIAQVPYATAGDVDRAARAAHAAFLKWREVPVVERVQVFYRYKELLEKHAAEIAPHSLHRERQDRGRRGGSVRRAIQMVEVACGMPSLMMGQSLENVSKGIDCQTIRQPLGVCAGITPFNFPAMVPMWMFPSPSRAATRLF